MSLPLNTLIEHKDVGMARPLDPRSRAHACRLTGINEATARKLEREGVLPPADTWTRCCKLWVRSTDFVNSPLPAYKSVAGTPICESSGYEH